MHVSLASIHLLIKKRGTRFVRVPHPRDNFFVRANAYLRALATLFLSGTVDSFMYFNTFQEESETSGIIEICGVKVDSLKLQSAKIHNDAGKCAQKMLSCLFTPVELVNGNPSGVTNSKDEVRRKTIKKLDPQRIKYICGKCVQYEYVLL